MPGITSRIATGKALLADPYAAMFAWQRTFGDTFRITLPSGPRIVLSNPADFKRVLVDNQKNYTKNSANYRLLSLILGQGLFTSEGALWRKQRRISQPAFGRQALNTFGEAAVRRSEAIVSGWEEAAEKGLVVSIAAAMTRLTLGVIADTLFGVSLEKEAVDMVHSLGFLLTDLHRRSLSPIQIPLSVPTPANRRFVREREKAEQIVRRMIDSASAGDDANKNLVTLLKFAVDPETGETMTEQLLRDELVTFMFAGHETTATTCCWALVFMSRFPEVRDRVRREVLSVAGDRSLRPDDFANLDFTHRVIKETMRLCPPAWGIERRATEADTLGGYEVPAGTSVWLPLLLLHRHPRYWANPEGFDPDRFLPDVASTRPAHAYLPFGAGPRMCIGASFASMEAVLAIATLVRKYDLELLEGIDIRPVAGMVYRPETSVEMRVKFARASS